VQAVINKNNEIIIQIITFVKPFFTLVNLNRIAWSISPDYTTMGCTSEQDGNCYDNEKPMHQVQVSSFYISRYEVTQEQWRSIMGTNPSNFNKWCDRCPVENVNWNDVQDFIKKLNWLTGSLYRLPTESEWEYAARGGQNYIYAGNNNLDYVGWYTKNSFYKTHPVGQKTSNGYGLYDMSGNVSEWTSSKAGSDRVYKGGCWNEKSQDCSVSSRSSATASNYYYGLGFRLAVSQ
jgi:formylglycine-generating enzyme